MRINPGSNDVTLYFSLRLKLTGAAAISLDPTTLTINFTRDRANRVGAAGVALASAIVAHSDNGVFEVDATNEPSLYRVDFPDAAFAVGSDRVQCVVNGPTIDPAIIEVELNYNFGTASDLVTAMEDTGTVLNRVDGLIEDDGSGNDRYTAKALEESAGGGGGATVEEIVDGMDNDSVKLEKIKTATVPGVVVPVDKKGHWGARSY